MTVNSYIYHSGEKENDKYYLGKAEQQIIKSLYTNEIDGLSKIFSKIKSLRLNPNFEGNNNMQKDHNLQNSKVLQI